MSKSRPNMRLQITLTPEQLEQIEEASQKVFGISHRTEFAKHILTIAAECINRNYSVDDKAEIWLIRERILKGGQLKLF